ncbi:MAG: glycosyltransferase family 2 protein [Patescibacteria group bacterium]
MYRFFEILPGALAWTTLILMVVFSWKLPAAVSVFIILFDVYWLLKTIYLSFHLRVAFLAMKRNMSENWLLRLNERFEGDWGRVQHLVLFPMYKEPYEVVLDSFSRILQGNYPKEKLHVVLALEERAGEAARTVGERIKKEFGEKFGSFLVTNHPGDISGELAGKGANETWAIKQAKKEIVDARHIPYEDILVSVFDIDTQVFSEYFGRLTYLFLDTPDRLRAIYQPVPFFTNNVFQAPALARVVSFSATFWQMMQQARPERLTSFSSQSIPFTALLDVGYWHTDMVSEDSRIFWQCFLHYEGDFKVVPLEYPVSMDANVAPTFWGTMKNLYLQQRRWGWGSENVPYLLDGLRKSKKISTRRKIFWTFTVLEGYHSWATNSLMIFALGWLPVALGGMAFGASLLSYSLPRITRFVIGLSMVGVATSAIMSVVLLPPKPKWFRMRHYALYVVEWIFIPITLIIFGAFPGLEAQTRLMLGGKFRLGFWVTPKDRR